MVDVVSRAAWGARQWVTSPHHLDPARVTHFLVHYHGGPPSHDRGAAMAKEIEAIHRANGWAGVGYQYMVGQDGIAYEGRGWGLTGAQCQGFNSRSVGVYVAVGGDQGPTPAALAAVRALYDDACRHFGRALVKSWHGAHYATACCGPRLIAWVKAGMPAGPPGDVEDDMPLTRTDVDLLFRSGESTGPDDVRAVYQVRDGKDMIGLTEAAGRQLALLRRIAADRVDVEALAEALVRRLPAGAVTDQALLADQLAEALARRLAD